MPPDAPRSSAPRLSTPRPPIWPGAADRAPALPWPGEAAGGNGGPPAAARPSDGASPASPPGPPSDAERSARMALAAVWEPGDRRVGGLIAQFGALELWEFLRSGQAESALAQRARSLRLDRLNRETELLQLRFVVPGDSEWPTALGELDGAGVDDFGGTPIGLWVAGPGRLDEWTAAAAALVGSRAATAYGEHMAAELAAGLAERGVTTVSGGAYGIDAASHRAAVAVGGRTVALMAGGLANVYPPGNARLLEQIRAEHLLVSEHPPDRTPTRPRFLARNRLIAALSQATVVVEAGARSGASNTARWALSLGRPLLAVPGPVTSALSWTPHRLIRDGVAALVTSAEDVVATIGPFDAAAEAPYPAAGERLDELTPDERAVFEELPRRGQARADDLAARLGLRVVEVLTLLGRLQDQGLADQTDRGGWRVARSVDRLREKAGT